MNDLNIEFSEKFDEESDLFLIRRSDVEEVINEPDREEELEYEGLRLKFFIRKFMDGVVPYYLWVETKDDGDKLTVYAAYKITEDMHPLLVDMSPLEMLETFIEQFGVNIRIGQEQGSLFMKKAIPIQPEKKDQFQFIDSGTAGSGSAWIMVDQEEGQWVAKCALAYTVNYSTYMDWLQQRRLSDY